MIRPPQFPLSEPDSLAVAAVKAAIKQLSPQGRAFVLAWLTKFYRDDGQMFSPSVSTSERRRVVIDSETFWLVRVPTK
jgi:hypothetical protein